MAFISGTSFLSSPFAVASTSISLTKPRRTFVIPRMSSIPPDFSAISLISANPAALQKVADAFAALNMPKWLVQFGHPAMMGFMVAGMGFPGAAYGWVGRLNKDKRAGVRQKRTHEAIMLPFLLLTFLGGIGGLLSTAMQGFDIGQSSHYSTAGIVLALLIINTVLAYSGFSIGNDGSAKGRLQGRKVHAYLGAAAMIVFLVHTALGISILLK